VGGFVVAAVFGDFVVTIAAGEVARGSAPDRFAAYQTLL
jgi:hypothetical protein